MKVIAITQARMGSSRLPGKILKTVKDKPLLKTHLDNVSRAKNINKIIVATSTKLEDTIIAEKAEEWGYKASRGSETDVLSRYYHAAEPEKPDYVVRITSDCPLIDPVLIDKAIDTILQDGSLDYVSNSVIRKYPDGVDVEVFKFSALEKAYHEAESQDDREHVTPFIWKNSTICDKNLFTSKYLENSLGDFSEYRFTLDYLSDFNLISELINNVGENKSWLDYVKYIDKNGRSN